MEPDSDGGAAGPAKRSPNSTPLVGGKPLNEFYDVIEEELLENSSNSEEMESEEDATETSKTSATSTTTDQITPNGSVVGEAKNNDVPNDNIKDTADITRRKSSENIVANIPDKSCKTMGDESSAMETDQIEASAEAKDIEQRSNASHTSADDLNDLNDDLLADEMDVSDVSSSFAENESIESKTPSPRKKTKKRQPPIMIGYKKRRKVHAKKTEDELDSGSKTKSDIELNFDNDSTHMEQLSPTSSDGNLSESSVKSCRSARKFSGTYSEVTCADKFCWICHKDGGNVYKCVACPRVYHPKCLVHSSRFNAVDDPSNFTCPECSAILKADNVNTRSPVLQTVNLDQLCTLLKHVIAIMKSQSNAHYFFGPVDTKEFPHYREYVVYPMDISILEKNVKNKVYGCTEAFAADVKWIVHNSIVFNTATAKITNVAKNLFKICKREVLEIETCAECYYNLLVRKETWFIEACKKPHLLVWARLKGYPPWPAKALKCKGELVDCRFFGAHDKAWVNLRDCYLYSKIPPQQVKVKKGSNLEEGIEEIERHIKKLQDKFGTFVYLSSRIPYNPGEELQQLQMMLPNYNPATSNTNKYLIHPDRIKGNMKPKALFNEAASSPSAKKVSSNDGSTSKDTPINETSKDAGTDKDDTKAADKQNKDEVTKSVDNSAKDNEAKIDIEEKESEQNELPMDTESKEKSSVATSESPTDTDTEESDSSKSVVMNKSSSTAGTTSKTETQIEAKRKLVSVKKIETINASVAEKPVVVSPVVPRTVINIVSSSSRNETVSATPITTVSRPQAVTVCQVVSNKANSPKMETIRTLKIDDKNKPKSIISVKNFAAINKSTIITIPKKDLPINAANTPNPSVDVDFDLDKVKDEPIENDGSINTAELVVKKPDTEKTPAKSLLTKSLDSGHRKRPVLEDSDTGEAKKSKNDSNCRTVNITENVTLSLINNQTNTSDATKNRPSSAIKAKPKTFTVPRSAIPDSSSSTDVCANGVASKPVRIAPAPSPSTVNKNPKNPTNRVCNGVPMNGTMPSRPAPNVMVLQPPRLVPKSSLTQSTISGVLDECMAEFQSNFRRAFEDTLDKIAGKGDLRAKVILLQKEIEAMKRNHELTIEEIKRDYEVQIAELRAASIAQKKFDLASERLKFEQEKERAVKEAKSKQWCSNCQKIANYYCCWNTAYCDFECQKDHWNQHMHVCKNDVKKKTAESSENEPPRIMMQNEVSSNYSLLNGYDKPTTATYTYQASNIGTSRSNIVTKMPIKNLNSIKTASRPLLPRVTATVTCSPSILSSSTSPMVTATFVDNSFQNISTNVTPIRSTMMGSLNAHSFIRQNQQYHK